MNARDRLQACLAGELPDRPPVALWRHFPVDDQSPELLAAATASFQKTYDFDFVKVTPASSFCLRDWGVTDEWRGKVEGTRDYTGRVIEHPAQWYDLPELDPRKGALAGQIDSLRLLREMLGPEVPVIQTIFSPLAQAKNLVGGQALLVHLRRDPRAVLAGLRIIAGTTARFIEAAAAAGIDGVFFAVQHAQFSELSPAEYEHYGRPFDLQSLEPAQSLWLNVLHLHGEEIFFSAFLDYPVPIINWHDMETPPSLAEAHELFSGVVCGGIRRWDTMLLGTSAQVRAEAQDAIRATGGRRFILGTGCVTPTNAPHGNILAARQSVETAVQ